MDSESLDSTRLLVSDMQASIDQGTDLCFLDLLSEIQEKLTAWQTANPGAQSPPEIAWEATALNASLVRRSHRGSAPSDAPIDGPGVIELLKDELAIAYWSERAASSTNPQARARYADLGWIARSATKDRRAYPLASVAVCAYIDQASGPGEWIDKTRALDRAGQLARALNNEALVSRVAEGCWVALQAMLEEAKARWSLDIFETLSFLADGFESAVSSTQFGELERILLEAARHLEASGNPHLAMEALGLAAESARRAGANERAFLHEVETIEVLRRLAKARKEGTSPSGGSLSAQVFVEQALHTCQRLLSVESLPPQLAETLRATLFDLRRALRQQILDTEEELKKDPLRIPVEYSWKEQDEYITHLLAGPEADTFKSLVRLPFLRLPLTSLEQAAAEQAQTTWIQDLFPTVVVRQGRKTTKPGGLHDPKKHLGQLLHVWFTYHMLDLDLCFTRLHAAGRLSTESYLAHFDTWSLFSEADRPFLLRGMDRYLNADYMSAIHVLVPRIEHMVKAAFESAGLPPIAIPNTTEVKEQTLGDFLRRPEVRKCLGEPLWTYLTRTLVEEDDGLNLRNDVAHGWIRAEDCHRGTANLALFIPLVLTLLDRRTA